MRTSKHPFLRALSLARRATIDAARTSPTWLTTSALLYLVLAMLPAATVWLLEGLLEASAGAPPQTIWPWFVGLTLAVGMAFPLGQVANAASQRLALRQRHVHQITAARAASAVHPIDLANPQVIGDLQSAHEAASGIDTIAAETIRLLGSAVTALLLAVAVGAIYPWAGVLVVLALLPTLVAFTVIARRRCLTGRAWDPSSGAPRTSPNSSCNRTGDVWYRRPAGGPHRG